VRCLTIGLGALFLALRAAAQAPRLEPQASGSTVRFQAISAVSERVAWVSGTRGTVGRTTDGGASWRVAVVPGADSLEFRDVHGFGADRAVLLAAGPGDRSRLYHTADGGLTWSLAFSNSDPRAFYDCIDFRGDEGVAVSDAVEGRFPLLRTTDGGRSWSGWTPPGYEVLVAQDGEGAFAASGTCLTLGEDRSAWIVTAKGARVIRFGPDQVQVFEPPFARGGAMAGFMTVAFRRGGVGIAAGGDLAKPREFGDNVVTTRDGGRSWAVAGRPPFAGPVFGVAYVPGRGGTVVAVGPRGAAWSGDDGHTWLALDVADYWSVGFAPNGTGWMVGPEGRIVRVGW